MRFAFLIPLRNPALAQNWERCVELCVQTLNSVCTQLSPYPDCKVVLVCREFPLIPKYENLVIIKSYFPDPEPTWEEQHKDKYAKIRVGLEYLSNFTPLYVMKMDADDLVSNRIVSYVLKDDNKRGYYVGLGYKWKIGRRRLECIENLHTSCGSTIILYANANELSKELVNHSSLLKLGHHNAVNYFHQIGKPLAKIPFHAVIYKISHGENITENFKKPIKTPIWLHVKLKMTKLLSQLFHKRLIISSELKIEFGI